MPEQSGDLKKRSGHLVYVSVAQAYSTDVETFALKGANVDHEQRRDRQPYRNETQASGLLGTTFLVKSLRTKFFSCSLGENHVA
jgi:hypothetical protein